MGKKRVERTAQKVYHYEKRRKLLHLKTKYGSMKKYRKA